MTAQLARSVRPPHEDGDPTPVAAQLAPVKRALLDDARARAATIVDDAHARADAVVAAAQHEVDTAVEAAARRAALAARARADAAIARARRDQRGAVLRTEAALRRELRARLRRAVNELVDDPRYPTLLDGLERLARSQLGDGAVVQRDPLPTRGVVATDAGRRVDYGLDTIADRAFATLEEEVAALWT